MLVVVSDTIRQTSTSSFGVGRREGHDSSAFYQRFSPPDLSDDQTIDRPAELLAELGSGKSYVGSIEEVAILPENSVALVVTSPPYFVGKDYELAVTGVGEDRIPTTYIEYLDMLRTVFAECKRVLEPGGRIAINVANLGRKPYRSLSADVIAILQDDLGLLLRGEIIWEKAAVASGSCAWGSFAKASNPVFRDLTERVIVASKGRFNRARSAPQRRKANLPHVSTLTNDEFVDVTRDVWRIESESATRIGHPAPFPVELPRRLIELYTYEDDLVVDPFVGSGTTVVAAARTGRIGVGFDTEPEYVELSEQRLAAELDRQREQATVVSDGLDDLDAETRQEWFHLQALEEGRKLDDIAHRVLADAGYATQAIGKWHCGDQPDFQPTNHGFDHYLGLPYSNDMGRQAGKPDFLPEMPPLPLIVDGEVVEQQPDQASLTDRYVAAALDFIRSCDDQPFFLYLAHLYVHLPIYVQERFAERSTNGPYGAAVASIDWATEVIMAELEARGIAEDTIVIFTSDNGSLGDNPPPWGSPEPLGGSNDPLRGTKGTTWEGGQRVPGIVRWPARVPAGRTSDAVVTAMDLFPTLAAVCGAEPPTDRIMDGRDIQELWFGETGSSDEAPSPHEAFFYYWMNDLEAVRSGRWKLHFAKKGDEHRALYDLDADIGETTDLLDQRPEVVERLEALAERARVALGDARLGREGAEVRSIGRVDDPAPLTRYDPDHPYVVAEYDLPDRG